MELWYKKNKNILLHLYYELINMLKCRKICIIDNNKTFNNFIYMMYVSSNKEIVDTKLYSDFFYDKYHKIS